MSNSPSPRFHGRDGAVSAAESVRILAVSPSFPWIVPAVMGVLPVLIATSSCRLNAETAVVAGATQRRLLSPLDDPSSVSKAGWKMGQLQAQEAAAPIEARLGRAALRFSGTAEIAGAKGDFGLSGEVPGETRRLQLEVHLGPDANIAKLGLQLTDGEGEQLLLEVPADWTGWKTLTLDMPTATVRRAYAQADKNGKLDQPVRGIRFVWFAAKPGPTSVAVDALTALTSPAGQEELVAAASGLETLKPGQNFGESVVLTNTSGAPRNVTLSYSLQRVAGLSQPPLPDPVWGLDHARGKRSWTVENGATLEEGSLTDGKDFTAFSLPWSSHQEAFQYIDLGEPRQVSHLKVRAGDANWTWKVDVAASADGQNYQNVAGMQGISWHKKWASFAVPVPQPFTARYLRFRHHNDGQKVNVIRFPSEIAVYDGPADENWNLPEDGAEVSSGQSTVRVPARDFLQLSLPVKHEAATGAYVFLLQVDDGMKKQLTRSYRLVSPAPQAAVTAQSRFGLNSSNLNLAAGHRELGIGWVRFENMKWPMISPEPGVYRYDGTIAPWNVPHDRYVQAYRDQGIQVLPFLFNTAPYASSIPESAPKKRADSYPPSDNAVMGEFVFQTVARYGARSHPAASLKTPDKKSGLDLIHYYEIWNEPNLTDPSWGPWVGTATQYLEMLRVASEAARRADPAVKITNGGLAGIGVEQVGNLATYRYKDGKRPLDFIDVLNVHYYSGQEPPETATVDTNVDRSGTVKGLRTYEDDLTRLANWRDLNKPGMPIWLTETGYDTGGPKGISEEMQAARLPRVVLMALAGGMDKVFVYRESGSTPSFYAASGVLRDDGSRKPAWFTYATLIRQLDGFSGARKLPVADKNLRLYSWRRGGQLLLTAWTVEGTSPLPLDLAGSQVTDSFGSVFALNAGQKVQASGYPLYIRPANVPAAIVQLEKEADEQEVQRRAQAARLSKLRAYLFDFGGEEHIGTTEIGQVRSFLPVLATTLYKEGGTFGFEGAPAMENQDRRWISDALERDGCKLGPGQKFRFDAAPGKYTLRLGTDSVSPGAKVTVSTPGQAPVEIEAKREGPWVSEIDLGAGGPITAAANGYVMLRWISLVER